MKELLIQTLTSAKGRFVSLFVGAAVAFATKTLANYNLTLDPEFENLISAGVGFVVTWGIDAIILHINAAGVKKIQEALPDPTVQPDGWAGPNTVSSVKEVIAQAEQ